MMQVLACPAEQEATAASTAAAASRWLAPGHRLSHVQQLQGSRTQGDEGPCGSHVQGKPPKGRSSKGKPPAVRQGAAQGKAGAAAARTTEAIEGPLPRHGSSSHREGCLLLHVHVPALCTLQQQLQKAKAEVDSAAVAAVSRVAWVFLDACRVFRSLVDAVADLDVLAGFSQVCCVCGVDAIPVEMTGIRHAWPRVQECCHEEGCCHIPHAAMHMRIALLHHTIGSALQNGRNGYKQGGRCAENDFKQASSHIYQIV